MTLLSQKRKNMNLMLISFYDEHPDEGKEKAAFDKA
jgi:hypothetical protein